MNMRSLNDMHAKFNIYSDATVAEKDKINDLWKEYLATDNLSPYLVEKIHDYMSAATSESNGPGVKEFKVEKFSQEFMDKILFGTFGFSKKSSKHVSKITDIARVSIKNKDGSKASFSMAKYGDKWLVLNEKL